MGGSVRKEYVIIGGVTKKEVKIFLDILVAEGLFESRSKAIGHILTEFMKKHRPKKKNDGYEA